MLRRARIVLALAILAATGCADRVRIDDGAQVGPLTQVKDWFTSVFVLPTDDGAVAFARAPSSASSAISASRSAT